MICNLHRNEIQKHSDAPAVRRTQRQQTTEHSLFILLHYKNTILQYHILRDISIIFVLLHFNRGRKNNHTLALQKAE